MSSTGPKPSREFLAVAEEAITMRHAELGVAPDRATSNLRYVMAALSQGESCWVQELGHFFPEYPNGPYGTHPSNSRLLLAVANRIRH